MLEWVLLVVTIIVLYKWLNAMPPNFPPGPPTVPILGSVPFIPNKHFHLYLESIRDTYGPVIGFKFGPLNAVGICGPEEVLEAMKKEEFAIRPEVVQRVREPAAIFLGNGETWKDQRRFALRHLRDFGFGKTSVDGMIQEEINEFCKVVLDKKKQFQVSGLFNRSSINILWAMMAGARLPHEGSEGKEALDAAQRFLRNGNPTGGLNAFPALKKFLSKFREASDDRDDRILKAFCRKALNEHRATKTDIPRDFLDVYIDEMDKSDIKPSFNEHILLAVCTDLFAAGAESSSNTVSFCLMYLLLHPEWQKKLTDEIDRELGNNAPTYDDRTRLPLTEAFVSEAVRCNTIAPLTVPHATTKDTFFKGFFLPKETFLHISIWTLLQDKKHWGDPENFRPERFIKNGAYVKDPYMMVFGAGPRACIGENLATRFSFLFFVSLLQRYTFSLPPGDPKPSTLSVSGFTTAPQPFDAIFEPRLVK